MENNILGMGRTIGSQRAHQKTWKEECRARPKRELSCTCLPETNQSKADTQNTKGWRPAIPTQTLFERLEGQAQGIWDFFQTVENKPLLFLSSFTWLSSVSQSGKGSIPCPVSEQFNDQAGGSGQRPAAAPFGNDSVTRSKGRFLLLHQLDLRGCLTSWKPYKEWMFPISQWQQSWSSSLKSSCIILGFTYHLSVLCYLQKFV